MRNTPIATTRSSSRNASAVAQANSSTDIAPSGCELRDDAAGVAVDRRGHAVDLAGAAQEALQDREERDEQQLRDEKRDPPDRDDRVHQATFSAPDPPV